jgi:pimeloyl-ACP methyl ester carboxylesterase
MTSATLAPVLPDDVTSAIDAFGRTQFTEVAGIRMAYRRAGTGPVLVLLHGFRGSGRFWQAYVPRLARTFTVIAPDLKGFGESAKPHTGYSAFEHASAVKGVLDSLGIDRAHVVGHSLGGVIALKMAALFPDLTERLVLMSTPLTTTRDDNIAEVLRCPFWMRWLVQYPHASRLVLSVRFQWLTKLFGDLRGYPKAIIEDANKYRWSSLAETFRKCFVDENMVQALPNLRLPALLIWGDNDKLVQIHHAHALQEAIPRAGLVVVLGADHAVPVTHVRQCIDAMTAFLGQHPSAGADNFAIVPLGG